MQRYRKKWGSACPGVMLTCAALLGATGCVRAAATPAVAPDEIETTLLLIGDAGEPDPRRIGAPLDSLRAHAAQAPGRTIVVFLGDNVYPDGIPEEGSGEWADALRRLRAQVDAVPAGARGIFVPGNHDWADAEAFGLYSIRLQGRLIEEMAGGRDVRLLPANGCPGPVSVDAGRLRLVLIDTQWWLHSYIVQDDASDCATDVHTSMPALRAQVRPARPAQFTVVAAHHPLMTGGGHGGYCGITGPWRRLAAGSQDILSSKNRAMRRDIMAAFAEHPPQVYAAGHDHNLQVLRGAPHADYLLVSGAGSHSKAACAVRMRESEWVSQYRSGFMRIDILRGRGALLRVYHFDGSGAGGLAFTRWLEERS